jgi:hypothetical protein
MEIIAGNDNKANFNYIFNKSLGADPLLISCHTADLVPFSTKLLHLDAGNDMTSVRVHHA